MTHAWRASKANLLLVLSFFPSVLPRFLCPKRVVDNSVVPLTFVKVGKELWGKKRGNFSFLFNWLESLSERSFRRKGRSESERASERETRDVVSSPERKKNQHTFLS